MELDKLQEIDNLCNKLSNDLSVFYFDELREYKDFKTKYSSLDTYTGFNKSKLEYEKIMWLYFFMYVNLYHKEQSKMEKEYDELDQYFVEIDKDPVAAGLNTLISKVAICRQYENRVTVMHSGAMKLRSIVVRTKDPLDRQYSYYFDEALNHFSRHHREEKSSSKEREAMAITAMKFAKEVKGLWDSFLKEVKVHEQIMKERKDSLSKTRADLLTQISGIKLTTRLHPGTFGHSAPELVSEDKYPDHGDEEGPVSYK